jgi:hypothetical protein
MDATSLELINGAGDTVSDSFVSDLAGDRCFPGICRLCYIEDYEASPQGQSPWRILDLGSKFCP